SRGTGPSAHTRRRLHHAHYPQAVTVTAVGHSTFLSGAPPSMSGIVANEWYERETGGMVTSVSDAKTFLVGGVGMRTSASPRRLLVSTIGDELKMSGAESKILSVSIKDRSAVLPGGRMADAAYWYDTDFQAWVTSSYYRETLPDWSFDHHAVPEPEADRIEEAGPRRGGERGG
ncbi:MAG TPA: alkaline phosphatase family protein, partial [Bryobacteraceae bacterium]|nr:alkaline phosphatase family protein [Bryobacteraceae bacterium]